MQIVFMELISGLTLHELWFDRELERDLQPSGHVPNLSHQFVVVFILVGEITRERELETSSIHADEEETDEWTEVKREEIEKGRK